MRSRQLLPTVRPVVLPIVIATAFLSGCGDGQARNLPDRGEHAYVAGGGTARPATGETAAARPVTATASATPGAGEHLLRVGYEDKLYDIAARHGTSIRWLIERNDLQRPIRAGDELIVPSASLR